MISQDSTFAIDSEGRVYCIKCHTRFPRLKQTKQKRVFRSAKDKDLAFEHENKDLAMIIRFDKDTLVIEDMEEPEKVHTFTLDKAIASVYELDYKYHITYKDTSCQVLDFKPFIFICKGQTKGEYILNIDMQDENRGYYFGLYEIGEFELINEKRINIIRSHALHYVDKGWVTKDKTLILSLRYHLNREEETQDYSIVEYTWEKNALPVKIWEITPTYSLNALVELDKNFIVFGYLNGSIGLFSKEKRKVLKTANIFNSGFLHMRLNGQKIYCSSFKGEIACITTKGEKIWKKKLTDSPIYNIEIKDDHLHVITIRRTYFILKQETGEEVRKKDLLDNPARSFSSNFIFYKNWIILSGDAHMVHIPESEKVYTIYSDDPLIRVVKYHPKGYLTGDDEGKIKFWGYEKVYFLSKRYTESLLV